ncbi:hypothetical protein KKA33_02140 [Patescibacteria group bacterium]|nr:hypothetical protein [Patescibacteria group bacterium]
MSTHFKFTLFILLIVFLSFLFGLYLAGSGTFSPFGTTVVMEKTNGVTQTIVKKDSYETGYNEALDFARQKLADKGEFEPIGSVTATVKSTSGQNIVIEFDASLLDPFVEGMATKTIVVGDDTQLYERVAKDEAQLEKEYADYEKAMQAFETALKVNPEKEDLDGPQEPQEYTVKTLAVGDFMAGDRVRIRADLITPEGDKEVEGEEMMMISPFASDTVQATEVRLYSRPGQEPEAELPAPLEEEMKEVAEEMVEDLAAEVPEVPEVPEEMTP